MGKLASRIRRLAHAWNTFDDQESNRGRLGTENLGPSQSYRQDRPRMRFANNKTIIQAIFTRLAIDVAAVPMYHVRLDENRQFQEEIRSGLDNCLTIEANTDQGARAFRQDIAMTLFDEGVLAILPVETTINPQITGSWDVVSLRVARVMQWYPQHVRLRAYNEKKGLQEEITVPKSTVAVVENPLYSVMNEPSGTLQRLLRKLNLLDEVDEQSASGKLDLIIQLPYVVKTETRRADAERRRKEIEFQLADSKHGIAYTDGTEKVVQLNRPVENNLMAQVTHLTTMLYGELGLTDTIMNGTADEATMINYYNRTIEPILAAIAEAMVRVFITKTGRTQGQSVVYLRNPFNLVPAKDLAQIADKFTRNEVLTANEVRSAIGFRPSKDPKADKLNNSNVPQPNDQSSTNAPVSNAPAPQADLDQLLSLLPASSSPPIQGVTSQNGSK
jgi:Phage portal protein